MSQNPIIALLLKVRQLVAGITLLTVFLFTGFLYYHIDPSLSVFEDKEENIMDAAVLDADLIENGIHVRTGLKEGEGLMLVVQNCTGCHSAKMITQNKATKEGWTSMIKWMQQTQNLWDLGADEETIVNYLAANYPPQKTGRRAPLTEIDWYELK